MNFGQAVAARTMWQECRGEPIEGQRAVANVIWNRLKSGRWGNSLASVCLWPKQFSGWGFAKDPNFAGACNLSDVDPVLLTMGNILMECAGIDDPTNGATHYFATSIHDPAWVVGATFCGQFGHQKFYKDVK